MVMIIIDILSTLTDEKLLIQSTTRYEPDKFLIVVKLINDRVDLYYDYILMSYLYR